MFSAQLGGSLDTAYYGFGVANLAPRASDQSLVPMDDHYVSANVDGKPMPHSIMNAYSLRYFRSMRGHEVIRLVDTHRKIG